MATDRSDGGAAHGCCGGPHTDDATCCPAPNTAPGINRRGFLTLGAAAAVALGLRPQGAIAVPAEKGLSATAYKQLARRGTPTRYTDPKALTNIGMPAGGAAAGQVYLSGDGRPWLWEVFNPGSFPYGGADWQGVHYADPLKRQSPFDAGFAVRWKQGGRTTTKPLSTDGFPDTAFQGRYPIATVSYGAPKTPLAITLDAYSPFIPTATEDSSLPATVFEFTLRNTTDKPLTAELLGYAENPVCLRSRNAQPVTLAAAAFSQDGARGVQHSAKSRTDDSPPREEIVFEDWERTDWGDWTAEGDAFGAGPVTETECPDYFRRFGALHITGERFVTSHNFRDGKDAGAADDFKGKLTSKPFTVSRRYVAVNVGGGSQTGKACVNVVVDGRTVASFTGRNAEPLGPQAYDVSAYEGKQAVIEIVDDVAGGWGHINCDRIWFTDTPADPKPMDGLTDNGTFAVAAAHPAAKVRPSIADSSTPDALFDAKDAPPEADGGRATVTGTVTVPVTLAPGASRTVRYVLAWHFDLVDRALFGYLTGADKLRRHYGTLYADAKAVAAVIGKRGAELSAATHRFVQTWYEDSTLPHWFLERTLVPASTVATSTVHRFQDGRFYAWEGLYCCDGTCTHVWNYAQSVARLFPDLERDARERVDFGLAFHDDTGAIDYRGEADRRVAHDGQCGNILRAYREHQMSADDAFLTRIWPKVKKAMQYLIAQDGPDGSAQQDGILQDAQYNTLDATWYGKIPWISGLYVAALHAAAAMADDTGDTAFAARCRDLAAEGSEQLDAKLWNADYGYYVQLVDPAHADAINSNRGCHLDQMYGQTYAFQLGLPRVFARDKARTALASMYKNNFLPDAQSYKDKSGIPGGRVYSTEGEAGTLLCTWPFGGSDTAPGGGEPFAIGYFNEVWTGVEYQFAAQLMGEGMADQALAVVRAVHDRHTAEKRNPYNEIECSDHYSRAMMSHAVYLAASGYEYHGPRGHLGFAPRLTPGDFAAAFTAAEGWCRYRQTRRGPEQTSEIEVRYGTLRLASFATEPPGEGRTARVKRTSGAGTSRPVAVRSVETSDGRTVVTLASPVTLKAGESLVVTVR